MTIAATVTSAQYLRNGVTTQWGWPNKIFSAADLTVSDVSASVPPVVTLLVLGTDYTVQNVDVDTGCMITTMAAGISGHTLDVRSRIAELQSTSIKNQGSFLPELHEEFFDKATRMLQDLQRLSYTFGIHGPDIESVPWTSLPGAATRANTYLGFDSSGLPKIVPAVNGALLYQPDDVRLFGALLNGVTDDTTAVAACLASNGTAFVPWTAAGILLNNLSLSASQYLYSVGRMQMFAKAGANWAVRLYGYPGPGMSGFNVQDIGNTTAQTTNSGGASAGAVSIVVANANPGPAIQVGQRISIEMANGLWHSTYVSSVAGTTIGLYAAIPTGNTVNSGQRIYASFGFIYVTSNGFNTQLVTIRDIIWNTTYAGILIDSPSDSFEVADCLIDNCQWPGSGRMFMVVNGRNCNNNRFQGTGGFGGWNTSASFTGNGATTQYSYPDNIFLTREATVKINGVTQVLGTNYSWVAGSNRTIQFSAPPAGGAAIALTGYTYGCEGLVDDKSTVLTQPQGGNDWLDCTALQFQRGFNFRNAQLWSFSNTISDTCSEAAYCFDACTYEVCSFNGVFLGWAGASIKLINGSLVKAGIQTWSNFPPGTQVLNSGAGGVSGLAGNAMSVDATSFLEFTRATPFLSVSATTIAAASTVYLGANGAQASINATAWIVPYACLALKLTVQSTLAPGAGQTFTYTVLDINLNVLATAVVSGAVATGTEVYIPAQALARDASLAVKLITSAGAAAGFHRIAVMTE